MNQKNIIDKFKGCIIGVAIGDVLGAPVEGMEAEEIKRNFGKITFYIENPDKNLSKGEYTDDTAMTIATMEALIENKFFDIHSIIKKFLEWFNDNPVGIGNTTYFSLYYLDEGYSYEHASKMVYDGYTAGNGAAMRIAPIALFNFKNQIERLIQDVIDCSIITHYHPDAIAGAIVIALLIYFNLFSENKKANYKKIFRFKDEIKSKNILKAVENASRTIKENLSPTGYIVDTVETTLWFYLNYDDPIKAIIDAVNMGGDTDTIASIIGALLGSLYGINKFPDKYIRGIKNYDYLLELSEKLYRVAENPYEYYEL